MAMSRYTRSGVLKGGIALSSSEACYVIYNAVKTGALSYTSAVIRDGDRLDHLAHSAYGNGRLWWIIAAASGIGWALQLPPGTVVKIPTDINAVAVMV